MKENTKKVCQIQKNGNSTDAHKSDLDSIRNIFDRKLGDGEGKMMGGRKVSLRGMDSNKKAVHGSFFKASTTVE